MTPQPRSPRPRPSRPRPSSWHQRARERATDAAAVLLTAGLLPLLVPAAATLEGLAAHPLQIQAVPAAENPPAPAVGSPVGSADRFERGRLTLQPDPAGGPPLFAPRGVLGLAGEGP